MNVIISACLLGKYCRYDGNVKEYPTIRQLCESPHIRLIPVCPEVDGGLSIPRHPAEHSNGRIVTDVGEDVTVAYEQGAARTLAAAQLFQADYAVLKEKSPSCGNGIIYDGTFSHTLVAGDGVAAALLKKSGIHVIGENDAAGIQLLLDRARG